MFEVTGQYNTAKIFTDITDAESIAQVIELCNQPYAAGSRIRLMPDIHAGAGCTIGTTMTIQDKICPNLVGVDIGCGMRTVQITEREVDFSKLDAVIREKVPSGFGVHKHRTKNSATAKAMLSKLHCIRKINLDRALLSVGTLGGGNHFIELDRDNDGNLYLVIHTGSRHLGVEIANYYQEAGYKAINTPDANEMNALVRSLKESGRSSEISAELDKYRESHATKIPKALAYVEGSLYDCYLHDAKIAQAYAVLNRHAIADAIIETMGWHIEQEFETIHNYIDTEHMILRKGAVSAMEGERLLIPINMRDGSLICVGKGNEDWNFSAPHGAGRLMSRGKAKEMFSVGEFRQQMEGIYTTSVGTSTLDECPMAYKNMSDILENISPTVTVKKMIQPVYNFKAG